MLFKVGSHGHRLLLQGTGSSAGSSDSRSRIPHTLLWPLGTCECTSTHTQAAIHIHDTNIVRAFYLSKGGVISRAASGVDGSRRGERRICSRKRAVIYGSSCDWFCLHFALFEHSLHPVQPVELAGCYRKRTQKVTVLRQVGVELLTY